MSVAIEDGDSLSAWLRLTLIPGIGNAGQRSLLKAFGTPEAIFEASADALASVIGRELTKQLLETATGEPVARALDWAADPQHTLLPLGDPRYPLALLDLPDPPNLLYAKGNPARFNSPAIAVVGSRNATAGGLQTAERFSGALADRGYVIVSGLALGIDTAAHQGALSSTSRGMTIAVIGTGIDRVYPARNQALAHRIIAEGGLILSEFPLGLGPQAHHFPRRNRLIAGLAKGVLVVEAALGSGSLITARLGAECGRDVFAIPGSIHSPQSRGCHQLIRDGAKLVETANDVLEELGTLAVAESSLTCKNSGPTPLLDDPVLCALGGDPLTVDELAARSGLTADSLLAMLFELELSGHVAALPGGRFQRLG